MRILICTGMFPPDIGGPATYSKTLADELPMRGIAVDVLSFGEVRHLPKIIRHGVYFFKALKRARNTDIVFAQDPVSVGVPAWCAAKLLGKKFALKIVGDYAWEQGIQRFGVRDMLDDFSQKRRGYGARVDMLKRVQTFIARRARAVIVPSAYLKRAVAAWGVPDGNIHVVYNGFEVAHFSSAGVAGKKSKKYTIVSAGRFVPWKGFAMLVEIMPQIRATFDAELVIVGDGPEKDRLAETVRALGLEEYVVFKGRLSHDAFLHVVADADVFALNTAYEGFSHQILEAMALGTPVVTTNACGNPELISSGKEGILASYNNKKEFTEAILSLLSDKALRNDVAVHAKQKAAQFSITRMVNGTLALLSRI
ncbi:glycosyltransferase family 4 protein [Candidatus Azambacteria bacterium]|nr:glycosyltransferase family 4 protein [Candidatus Azambacteria bacterium]